MLTGSLDGSINLNNLFKSEQRKDTLRIPTPQEEDTWNLEKLLLTFHTGQGVYFQHPCSLASREVGENKQKQGETG